MPELPVQHQNSLTNKPEAEQTKIMLIPDCIGDKNVCKVFFLEFLGIPPEHV